MQSIQRRSQSPYYRDDNKEYWTVAPNGVPIKVEWGMMTRRQKELQVEAENRAAYVAEFGIY
jgi:hypothetical protein